MKHNLAPSPPTLQQHNVEYRFECPLPHSKAEVYVGYTTTTLSRRLTIHNQNGSILKHFKDEHKCRPTREQLVENTSIIAKDNDKYRLSIKEALIILKSNPSLNIQSDNFTTVLKLHGNTITPKVKQSLNSLFLPTRHSDQESILSANSISIVEIPLENNESVFTNDDKNLSCHPQEPVNTPYLTPISPLPNFLNNLHDSTVNTQHDFHDNVHSTPKCSRSKDSKSTDDDSHLPDMEIVLKNFGIKYDKLKFVPLKDYCWWEYNLQDVESIDIEKSPSCLEAVALWK